MTRLVDRHHGTVIAMSGNGCRRNPWPECSPLPASARDDAGGSRVVDRYGTQLCQRLGTWQTQSQRASGRSVGGSIGGRTCGLIADTHGDIGKQMAGKYEALTEHLKTHRFSEFDMTFAQIEQIIGAALPKSAHTPQFWANTTDLTQPQRRAIAASGFESFFISESKKVKFKRLRRP